MSQNDVVQYHSYMSNSKLSKKTMTRLLNAQYRKSILRDAKSAAEKQIEEYAKFVVNGQISQRMS